MKIELEIDPRAVVLNRVSSLRQEDGFSLDAQNELNREYCKRKYLDIVQTFTFSESAGPQKIRREFQSVLDFMKNHEIRNLVVEKTDRLLRNFYDYIKIEEMMQEHGLHVHFPKEGSIIHKYSNSHEKQVFGFKVLIAKGFLDNLSEETKKGLIKKVEAGGYPIRAPYGYYHDLSDKKLRIKEIESEFICRLFEKYAIENISVDDLADLFNAEGIRPPRGHSWYGSTLYKMLRNPVYYGDIRWKNTLYKGIHKGLVSYELWKKCSDKLLKSGGPKEKRRYLLAGFLTYYNGRIFSGELQKARVYYGARVEKAGRKGQRVYVREDDVFRKIDAQVARISWSENFSLLVNDLAREMISEEKAHVDKNKASFEAQLRSSGQKKNRLLDLYTDGHLERAMFLQKMAELDRNEEYLLNRLERYQMDESALFEKIAEISTKFLNLRKIYRSTTDEAKIKILRSMCDTAVIDEKKGTELKLKDPYVRFVKEPILAHCQTEKPVRHHTLMRPLGGSNPYYQNENLVS